MDQQRFVDNLKRRGYEVTVFDTGAQAAAYLNEAIDGITVGFGDSETMLSMGLYDLLSAHNRCFDPMHRPEGETFRETARKTLLTDVFLTSLNAMSETGELVNIDGTGNRVAGSLFGHEKVYFVVSLSKLCPTLDDAIFRARNVAAPQNAARHGFSNPCALKGDRCYDCSARDRICNALVVHYRKMRGIEMEVVLIREPLGL